MYIIKNAFKCIGRSKGRNVLIGIIALVIAISACIGLSIRQAAISAKESALSGMSINATISFNRMDAIQGLGGKPGGGGFNREEFENMMGRTEALTLDEYLKYAEAASVDDFYYTLTVYFNGNDEFLPVSNSSSSGSGISGMPNIPGMQFPGGGGSEGDFTIVGVSTDSAMTDFFDGTSSIYSGEVFEEGTSDYVCIISYELAGISF